MWGQPHIWARAAQCSTFVVIVIVITYILCRLSDIIWSASHWHLGMSFTAWNRALSRKTRIVCTIQVNATQHECSTNRHSNLLRCSSQLPLFTLCTASRFSDVTEYGKKLVYRRLRWTTTAANNGKRCCFVFSALLSVYLSMKREFRKIVGDPWLRPEVQRGRRRKQEFRYLILDIGRAAARYEWALARAQTNKFYSIWKS